MRMSTLKKVSPNKQKVADAGCVHGLWCKVAKAAQQQQKQQQQQKKNNNYTNGSMPNVVATATTPATKYTIKL